MNQFILNGIIAESVYTVSFKTDRKFGEEYSEFCDGRRDRAKRDSEKTKR